MLSQNMTDNSNITHLAERNNSVLLKDKLAIESAFDGNSYLGVMGA
jgi:hypothetical protein